MTKISCFKKRGKIRNTIKDLDVNDPYYPYLKPEKLVSPFLDVLILKRFLDTKKNKSNDLEKENKKNG